MKKEKVKINFNPDLFNNIYWLLDSAFQNTDIRFIWGYGGSSASKTYSVVQQLIVRMLSGEDENAMVLRKYATDIKDSIYADFKSIIHDWDLEDLFIIQQNYIKCKTGSYVRFRGLDESGKIKGLSGFKRIVLDEIDQFEEIDLKQIRLRLRGKVGQQIICLFNPVTEEHWIKTNIFDKEVLKPFDMGSTPILDAHINIAGNTLILKTNYQDNKYIVGEHFVDKHVIEEFERYRITDFNYYNIYALGNWGKLRTGGEYMKDFNANIHVKPKREWNEDLPIHMSFDENVNPYLPCSVWQIEATTNKKKFIQIDEICLEDPMNRRHYVCNEFKKRFPVYRVKGLYVYGDKTAQKEDTGKEKGENFFTDILFHLTEYKPQLRLQSSNPSVKQSGEFTNEIYRGLIPELEIEIWSNCKKSINDYQYALEDVNGNISKKTKQHPITKIPYQEFGHLIDCKRYLLTMAAQNEYAKFLQRGKTSKVKIGVQASKNAW